MIWGFAGPWYGEYKCYNGDVLMNQLKFCADNGFKSMNIDLNEMKDPARRDQIVRFVQENDMSMTIYFGCDWYKDSLDTIKQKTDALIANLEKYGSLLRVPIITGGAGGSYHRFVHDPSLDRQLEQLSKSMAYVTKACHENGRPFGIENHGDYYCIDFVKLCRMTPHLGIFLDTGNTYLIGEQSLPACEAAAPYTIGTHFKDHLVHPDPRTLTFVLGGAVLGSGDVGLREIYDILLKKAPNPEKLVMHWELITPKGMNPNDAVNESWKFIHTLPGVK